MNNDPSPAPRFTSSKERDESISSESAVLRRVGADGRALEARISPEFGSNLYKLSFGGRDLIWCDPKGLADRDWTGCFVLWPIPNRVRGKSYDFGGRTVSLEKVVRRHGNAPLIHGLVDDKPFILDDVGSDEKSAWAVTHIDIDESSPAYEFFPFVSRLTLTYTLSPAGLRVAYAVENKGAGDMPFGFALHPYFSLLSGKDGTLVSIPAASLMESDEELLPTGRLVDVSGTRFDLREPQPVSELDLDDVFTTLEPGKAPFIDHTGERLRIWLSASGDFTHVVLFTRADAFICFENQTGSTDMINLHERALKSGDEELERAAHLMVARPGETLRGHIEYGIEEY